MKRLVILAAVVALVLAACGNDGNDDAGGTTGSSGGDLTVQDAWARSTPDVGSRAAVYLTIHSDETDELVGASVASEVAGMAQLHETVTDGVTSMRAVDAIPVQTGTTTLEPGGYHIMLMDLAAPLEEGQTFELTLEFQNAGERSVEVEVRGS